MPRAQTDDVQKLLDSASEDVTLFVIMASTVVDEFLASSTLSAAVLALIETFLAAHFALLATERGSLAEKTLGEAREKYHNIYKAGFNATRFGQQAIILDTTGTLAGMSGAAENTKNKKALFRLITSAVTSE